MFKKGNNSASAIGIHFYEINNVFSVNRGIFYISPYKIPFGRKFSVYLILQVIFKQDLRPRNKIVRSPYSDARLLTLWFFSLWRFSLCVLRCFGSLIPGFLFRINGLIYSFFCIVKSFVNSFVCFLLNTFFYFPFSFILHAFGDFVEPDLCISVGET